MSPESLTLVVSICAGIAAVTVVTSLWTFVRCSRLEGLVANLDTKLPHKRVVEMEQCVDSLIHHVEGIEQKNVEFKQSVHNSVQRLDQIMRRNEKALDGQKQLLDEDGNLQESAVPGELPPDLQRINPPVGGETAPAGMSKQKALALRYRQNRGM